MIMSGSMWSCLDQFGNFWIILVMAGLFWSGLEYFGQVWITLVISRSLGAVSINLVMYGLFLLFLVILFKSGSLWLYLDHFGHPWSFLVYMSLWICSHYLQSGGLASRLPPRSSPRLRQANTPRFARQKICHLWLLLVSLNVTPNSLKTLVLLKLTAAWGAKKN